MLRLLASNSLSLVCLVLGLAGCGSAVAPCPPGSHPDAVRGVCLPDVTDGGAQVDADVRQADLGVSDGGMLLDAAPADGGGMVDQGAEDLGADQAVPPCVGSCGGETPTCDVSTGTCVGCLGDRDCPSGHCDAVSRECVECLEDGDCLGGLCDPADHRCVACLENAHCTHLAASRCDPTNLSCGACRTAADCSHIPGRPACVMGACEACAPANGDECGPYSCSQLTLQCTDNLRGYSDVYEACEANSECAWGPCVLEPLLGPDRHVCAIWYSPADGCGSSFPVHQVRQSIHGASVEVCMLRDNWLTFEAAQLYMHYYRDNTASPSLAGYACSTNADCPFGTYCRQMQFLGEPASTNHCAIAGCTGSSECPGRQVCRSGPSGQTNYCAIWD